MPPGVLHAFRYGTPGRGRRPEQVRLRLALENDIATATEYAAVAEEHLKGFDLPAVEVIARAGPAESPVQILEVADAYRADWIAMGEEGARAGSSACSASCFSSSDSCRRFLRSSSRITGTTRPRSVSMARPMRQ